MENPDKYAVISDVHANAEALRAVLRDIRKRQIYQIFFLGDAVGYGPDPDECVGLLKSECQLLIAGNHDWAVLGRTATESFNDGARLAISWTRGILHPGNKEILGRYLLKAEIKEKGITLVHATPYEPEHWHYLMTKSDAERNFECLETDICFIGHSHRPEITEMDRQGVLHIHKEEIACKKGHRFIINAGSVGQPRDGDPRACYAVFEGGRVGLVRVEYDIHTTQKKMREAGLPEPLTERLSYGL
jgi:predicted phosphodiesterase